MSGGNYWVSLESLRDVTERKRPEEQNIFLVRLDDAMRILSEPDQMMCAAAQLLGEQLQVDRRTYCHVGPDEETLDMLWDYLRPYVPSMVGRYRLTQFGEPLAQSLLAEETCSVADTETDPSSQDVLAS